MTDNINDYYFNLPDWSVLTDFIRMHGALKEFGKGDYFARQGETSPQVGLLEEGMFRCQRTDASGNEHVVGYSFAPTLMGEYTSCLCNRLALADIRAIQKSRVYVVHYDKIASFYGSSPENERLGRRVAEQLFVMSYRRLLDFYCSTPEERYLDLMHRYPELKELRPLKEIASFIGVTPETVSAIRRKLLKKK